MAKEVISLEVNANVGQAEAATKTLKQQLREANLEAQRMSEKFGELSPQAINAAKHVAALKDKMGDLNSRIEALNPEAKFKAIGQVASGIAGGFAAAQGAMALFGSESEDLQKSLLKVQGALALSQGVEQIAGLSDAFSNLRVIIGEQIKSLFTLRGALIASGIGALGLVIGGIVANWKEFRDAIISTFPALKSVGEFFDNFKRIAFGALSGVVEGFKVVGETIYKLFSGDLGGAVSNAKTFGTRVSKAYGTGYKEQQKKEEDEAKAIQDEINRKKLEAEQKHLDELKRLREKKLKEDKDYIDKQISKNQIDELDSIDIFQKQKAQLIQSYESKTTKDLEDEAAHRIAIENNIREAKISIATDTANAISSLGNILISDSNKMLQFQKTMALIQIGIDTARAVSGLVSISFSPTNGDNIVNPLGPYIKLAAGSASILANIAKAKQILSSGASTASPTLGGGGGGSSNFATPTGVNTGGTIGGNRTNVDANSINNAGSNSVIRAVVVESDITNSQDRRRRIENQAGLGG